MRLLFILLIFLSINLKAQDKVLFPINFPDSVEVLFKNFKEKISEQSNDKYYCLFQLNQDFLEVYIGNDTILANNYKHYFDYSKKFIKIGKLEIPLIINEELNIINNFIKVKDEYYSITETNGVDTVKSYLRTCITSTATMCPPYLFIEFKNLYNGFSSYDHKLNIIRYKVLK